jgi:hypothetical protein
MAERIRAGGIFHRASSAGGNGHRILVVVVAFPNAKGEAALFQVVDAIDLLRFFLGRGERRQKHRRQKRENGNDNEQHDKCKSTGIGVHVGIITPSFFYFKQLSFACGNWILASQQQFKLCRRTRFFLYLFSKAVWLALNLAFPKTK